MTIILRKKKIKIYDWPINYAPPDHFRPLTAQRACKTGTCREKKLHYGSVEKKIKSKNENRNKTTQKLIRSLVEILPQKTSGNICDRKRIVTNTIALKNKNDTIQSDYITL